MVRKALRDWDDFTITIITNVAKVKFKSYKTDVPINAHASHSPKIDVPANAHFPPTECSASAHRDSLGISALHVIFDGANNNSGIAENPSVADTAEIAFGQDRDAKRKRCEVTSQAHRAHRNVVKTAFHEYEEAIIMSNVLHKDFQSAFRDWFDSLNVPRLNKIRSNIAFLVYSLCH